MAQYAQAQNVFVKEIRLSSNAKCFKTKEASIIYPIIITNNKAVSKWVNITIIH